MIIKPTKLDQILKSNEKMTTGYDEIKFKRQSSLNEKCFTKGSPANIVSYSRYLSHIPKLSSSMVDLNFENQTGQK